MKRSMEMEVSASLATPGAVVSETLSRAPKTSSLKADSSAWSMLGGIVVVSRRVQKMREMTGVWLGSPADDGLVLI